MSKSTYTTEKADLICDLLAHGMSLVTIAKRDDMPNRVTIHEWIDKYPEFGYKYTRAREDQADFYAESTIDIADETEVEAKYNGDAVKLELSTTAVARNRLRVDARKWYASKLLPKKYGDKTMLSNDPENPFDSVNLVDREEKLKRIKELEG